MVTEHFTFRRKTKITPRDGVPDSLPEFIGVQAFLGIMSRGLMLEFLRFYILHIRQKSIPDLLHSLAECTST
jgi:hypothetical protein